MNEVNIMKKFIKLLTLSALSLTLLVSGCSAAKKSPELFDQYLTELPALTLDPADFGLNFLFNDATKFGIQPELYELGFSSKEDYETSIKETEAIIAELKTYDYKKMSDEQKLNYDILLDYYERSLLTSSYYYLDNSYLGSFIGFQAQLPMLLSEYSINNQFDYDSLVNLFKTSNEYFVKYGEHEVARQAEGVGMTKTILEKVIEQCDNFIKGDPAFIYETLNEKIDAATFFDDTQKAANKAEIQSLVTNEFVQAYQSLKDILVTIDNAPDDLGLASMKDGKAYYDALMKTSTGIDMSIEEIKDYLNKKFDQLLFRMQTLMMSNPSIQSALNSEINYSSFTSAEENLDYLESKLTEFYPEVPNLTYTIKRVPDALKDNFSPAAYLTSKIDMLPSETQMIYINGDYDQSLFNTIAHEGYPGHMYQDSFFKNLKLPAIRYIIGFNGYSEGWATYVENTAYRFSTEDQALLEFMQLNQTAVQTQIILSDIGIHYEGWDFDQYKQFMLSTLGGLDDEVLKEQYLLNLETPTNYANYYLNGMFYQDLYDKAESELKDKFSPVEFNRLLLTVGPSAYSILEKEVDKFIANNK